MPPPALLVLLTLPLAGVSLWYLYRYYDQPQHLMPASAAVVLTHTGTGILLTLGYLFSLGNRVI